VVAGAKARNALNQHWQKKNAAKKNILVAGLPNKYSSRAGVPVTAPN
jgi:hypothetical protein